MAPALGIGLSSEDPDMGLASGICFGFGSVFGRFGKNGECRNAR